MRSREFEQREYDCFISYGSEDREIAERLKAFMALAGLKAFLDVHNFPAGNEVIEGLATKMAQSKACLALASIVHLRRSISKRNCGWPVTRPLIMMSFALSLPS